MWHSKNAQKTLSPRQQKLRLPWKWFVVQTTGSFDVPLDASFLGLSTFNNPQATLSSVQTHYLRVLSYSNKITYCRLLCVRTMCYSTSNNRTPRKLNLFFKLP